MLKNHPQSQASTSEQLDVLKTILIDSEYTDGHLVSENIRSIVKIANFYGLYDAADAIVNRCGKEELAKILSW
jgi:hypothetical protein